MKRGRPSVIDRAEIGAAAIGLFGEQGFEATSWHDIAHRVGVSARTLQRHFRSKEELAWVGIDRAAQILDEALESAPPAESLTYSLHEAIVASTRMVLEHPESSRAWLTLVASEPALLATTIEAHRPWVSRIERYLMQHRAGMTPTIARGIAIAHQVIAFDTLLEWANSDTTRDPQALVREALHQLHHQFHFSPIPPKGPIMTTDVTIQP